MEFNDGALKFRGYSWLSVGLSHSVNDFGGLHIAQDILNMFMIFGLLDFSSSFKLRLTLFMLD